MSCEILLIDGNAVLFKAYYATYSGANMRTQNGISTNAVYGFVNMINKAIKKLDPEYVMVAWDSGKPTFRHEQFHEYKGTRKKLDPELKMQFPIVREYLDAYGIYRYEQDGIEADDIIGTLAKRFPEKKVHILSSDRDLLQLIDGTTDVLLMKKGISEMILMNEHELMERKEVEPWQIIEMKGLMGDTSDNIPGVKGIGEKTALKLLQEYESIDGVYAHIHEIKGKLQEKLVAGKDMAYVSKSLATIKLDCAIEANLADFKFQKHVERLNDFFLKYEMHSLIQKVEASEVDDNIAIEVIETLRDDMLRKDNIFLLLDYDNGAFYNAQLYGMAFCIDEQYYYMDKEHMLLDKNIHIFLSNSTLRGYDVKKMYHLFHRYGFSFQDFQYDLKLSAFLVDSNVSNIRKLYQSYHMQVSFGKEDVYGKTNKYKNVNQKDQLSYISKQLHAFCLIDQQVEKQLLALGLEALLYDIEMPLTKILYEMEQTGITTSKKVLQDIEKKMLNKLLVIEKRVYELCDKEFNINSPKQLAAILFDDLGLPSGKKRSTSIDVLEKLQGSHPIIDELISYRKYQKINSTYAEGLQKHILADGKIHTVFNQALAQTGRLSSSEPNLQNLSIKDEEAREIRKAFIASPGNVLYATDYSQIELRMLAHMAEETEMIDAFNHKVDIHTKTAMLIFGVAQDSVTASMRREAKTVNFGMVYGQTQFGLSAELKISMNDAKDFMDAYFTSYPKIKVFMERQIAFCKEHSYVETMFHRRRTIHEINDKDYMMREFAKRAAMNAPIQGSAADLMKLAMIKCAKLLKEKGLKSKMILQIHDELVFDVVEEERQSLAAIVSEAMEHVYALKVPLVADGVFADNYYEAK
ncbi:MAG: DNA polymerase I [Breznakia sp.]